MGIIMAYCTVRKYYKKINRMSMGITPFLQKKSQKAFFQFLFLIDNLPNKLSVFLEFKQNNLSAINFFWK